MWVCRSPVHIGPRKVQQLYENLQQIRSIYAAVSVLFFQLFRLDDLCLDCSVLHALQLNAESGGKRPLDLQRENLPLDAEPAPALAVADDATGQQLEAEAAEQYRAMAAAAAADGITLELVTGYQDVSAREAAFDARKQVYLEKGLSEEEAAAYAASVCPPANASEQATGYAADILSPDCTEKTTRFADTRAYEWLTAYAAEYGFVLRWPEERQAATGMVYEPWHWRYVGVENALAIRASGLSLEEFLALERTKL